MGKMLGIRPPKSADRTGEGEVGQPKASRQSGFYTSYRTMQNTAKLKEVLRRISRGNSDSRRAAAKELTRIAFLADTEAARGTLSRRLEEEKSSSVRANLLKAISEMAKCGLDCSVFVPQIQSILREGSDFEQMECANALKNIGDRASVPPLAAALESGKGLLPPAKRAIEGALGSLKEREDGGDEEEKRGSLGVGIDIST